MRERKDQMIRRDVLKPRRTRIEKAGKERKMKRERRWERAS